MIDLEAIKEKGYMALTVEGFYALVVEVERLRAQVTRCLALYEEAEREGDDARARAERAEADADRLARAVKVAKEWAVAVPSNGVSAYDLLDDLAVIRAALAAHDLAVIRAALAAHDEAVAQR